MSRVSPKSPSGVPMIRIMLFGGWELQALEGHLLLAAYVRSPFDDLHLLADVVMFPRAGDELH